MLLSVGIERRPDGTSNHWEAVFHTTVVNSCFTIFMLDSYFTAYANITLRLIRMVNGKYMCKTREMIISCKIRKACLNKIKTKGEKVKD